MRRTASEISGDLSSGDFLTTDAFRRTSEAACHKIHEAGLEISLGTSSDRPKFIVQDVDLVDDDERSEGFTVDFADIRSSSTWNAMASVMSVNDQRFIVEDDDGEQLVVIRMHPDYDRSEVIRLAARRKQTERDRRIASIEKTVLRIAEKIGL